MIHTVILAGGRGTRFWPLSRKSRPKQMLRLSSDRTSLLEDAVERARRISTSSRIYVCTTRELSGSIEPESLGLPRENIIIEPFGRDSAAALALSSMVIGHSDPGAVMVSMTSDHVIGDLEGFSRTMEAAESQAELSKLVVVGVEPTRPETGFGYIERGAELNDGAFEVIRFVEKPDHGTASEYLESGEYLWNSGIFVWRCDCFLQELSRHMPVLFEAMDGVKKSLGGDHQEEAIRDAYSVIEPISIDYGLLEKVEGLVGVTAHFDWDDLGSWDTLGRLGKSDLDGNVFLGGKGQIDLGSKNCITYTDGPFLATLDLEDLIVVATGDAVLVARRGEGQRVRKIVEEIEKQGYLGYL